MCDILGEGKNQINCVVNHPTLPVSITAHEDRHIRFFDNNTGKVHWNSYSKWINRMLFGCFKDLCCFNNISIISWLESGNTLSLKSWWDARKILQLDFLCHLDLAEWLNWFLLLDAIYSEWFVEIMSGIFLALDYQSCCRQHFPWTFCLTDTSGMQLKTRVVTEHLYCRKELQL